ncbi:MAG: beta-L-arabinofuranosidase domain-containing protein, partial [Actinoplanes sp.]
MTDAPSSAAGPVVPTPDALTVLRPLGLDTVRLQPTGLLGGWQQRNAAATLPHCVAQVAQAGNLSNLRRVTGEHDGPFRGMWFADSDLYKTAEAAAWETASRGAAPPALREFRDGLAALLVKAQDEDGYLNSYFQVDHRDRQWRELRTSHELYCAGHLIQAAVAAAHADRRTGTQDGAQLVAVARRFADLLVTRYGPDGEEGVCGHPEIETALVELYRVTGHGPYLELAARFIDRRGRGLLGTDGFGAQYYQDHAGVREAGEVTGHVVRQLYLLAGAVDVAVERRDTALLAAAQRLWESAIGTKTYLTGGQGSRHRDEAYGDAYELPPDRAYAETCAAIASFQLAWRLLLATGKVKYADEMERVLHNAIAGATSLDGRHFFYSNPLQLRTGHDGSHEDAPTQRLGWYSCACCPPNLERLLASLHTYLATGDETGLQLHLYAAGTFGPVTVSTRYPWDEQITVSVTRDAAE